MAKSPANKDDITERNVAQSNMLKLEATSSSASTRCWLSLYFSKNFKISHDTPEIAVEPQSASEHNLRTSNSVSSGWVSVKISFFLILKTFKFTQWLWQNKQIYPSIKDSIYTSRFSPRIKPSTLWVSNFYEEANCERKLSPRAVISTLVDQWFSTAQPIRTSQRGKGIKSSIGILKDNIH